MSLGRENGLLTFFFFFFQSNCDTYFALLSWPFYR